MAGFPARENPMKLIFLHGALGAGKLTTAKALLHSVLAVCSTTTPRLILPHRIRLCRFGFLGTRADRTYVCPSCGRKK
jgi:hypothetical protein